MDQTTEYIKQSLLNVEKSRREYQLFDDIFVYVKDQFEKRSNVG